MAKKVQRAWFVETVNSDEVIGVVEKTSRTVDCITDDWKALTEALTVRYESIICDADLTGVASQWSEINSRYHKTIVNKAIAMGYRNPENQDLKNAEYFENLYEKDVRRAKKFAKGSYVSTGFVVPQDF